MPNGMMADIEFENQLAKLGDNQTELIKFVARQQFESCRLLSVHDGRIAALETGSKKLSGITGGISGTLSAVVISVISYFTANRG